MYYFIVNPKSRTGHGEKIWAEIQQKLQKEKIPYHSFSTEYAGHAKTIAEKITQKSDRPRESGSPRRRRYPKRSLRRNQTFKQSLSLLHPNWFRK